VSIAVRPMLSLMVAILLTGTTPPDAPVGFIDLTALVEHHPMHAVLVAYDREIAALRSTLTVPEFKDAGAQTAESGRAIANETAEAASRAQNLAAQSARDRNREHQAIATVIGSQRAASEAMNRYAAQLASATETNLAGYRRSIAESATRALAAREQQLREKELTYAFGLARAGATKRLTLRLKLDNLHPDAATRAQLEAQLSALDARDAQAVTAMQHRDAAVLADYRVTVERDAARANTQMAEQLRAKAAANLALRRKVLYGEVIPSQLQGGDNPDARAAAVASELRSAGSDLSHRFTALAQSAGQSQQEAASEIRALEQKRYALRQAIVAQILRAARTFAQTRHLSGIVTSGPRPAASVDLTRAVQTELDSLERD
jgi:hypothetical protein